ATIMVLAGEYPELLETLARPDWARGHLDELLRLRSPVAGLARTVAVDTTIGGTTVRKGEKVIVHVASADHDEAQFERAAEPDLGEGLEDAEIVEWHVSAGDHIELNQAVASVETAKAVVEVPSPFAGTVLETLGAPGETLAVGAVLVRIDTGDGSTGDGSTGD